MDLNLLQTKKTWIRKNKSSKSMKWMKRRSRRKKLPTET